MTRPGVRVRIGPDGCVHAETVGLTGESCLDVVPLVEDLVAARVVASEYLPEFFTPRISRAAGHGEAAVEEPPTVTDTVAETVRDDEQVRYVTERDP